MENFNELLYKYTETKTREISFFYRLNGAPLHRISETYFPTGRTTLSPISPRSGGFVSVGTAFGIGAYVRSSQIGDSCADLSLKNVANFGSVPSSGSSSPCVTTFITVFSVVDFVATHISLIHFSLGPRSRSFRGEPQQRQANNILPSSQRVPKSRQLPKHTREEKRIVARLTIDYCLLPIVQRNRSSLFVLALQK